MSRRTYSGYKCWLCEKSLVSCNGLAVYNHNMGHVRRGEMVVHRWIDYRGHLRREFKRSPKPAADETKTIKENNP